MHAQRRSHGRRAAWNTKDGGHVKMRLVAVASAATAMLLFSACGGDGDGPTTLAKGADIELVGDSHSGLGNQTLNIDAEEENGEVAGEFRVTDNVITLECADTDTDGVVILGGEGTAGQDFDGELLALIIREGDPDSVSLYANDSGAESCAELLESISDEGLTDDSNFVAVEDGYDIETG